MSAMRSSTSDSFVAQLVQKRTMRWPSSARPHSLKEYFSARASSSASGAMTNCWFVGESL